jgi:inhibitor of KinA sporulation pathway (predicted exonuclease)
MEFVHWIRRHSPKPRINLSFDGEPDVRSMNQNHQDKALDETNAAVLSDFANNA